MTTTSRPPDQNERCFFIMAKTDSRTSISGERADIALNATWEIEGLADIALSNIPPGMESLALRGIVARIKSLNSAIMSAIGEPDTAVTELRERVYVLPRP